MIPFVDDDIPENFDFTIPLLLPFYESVNLPTAWLAYGYVRGSGKVYAHIAGGRRACEHEMLRNYGRNYGRSTAGT